MKIGIVAYKTGENSFGVSVPYLEYFQRFGDPIFISPWYMDDSLDLIVLPGGPDVDPTRYGEFPGLSLSKACPYREYFDKYFLPNYIKLGIPIFGICRGMQSIAVTFGASLYQDMYHETNPPHDRSKKVHPIDINEDIALKLGIISKVSQKKKYEVNSLHHQIINEKTIPDELKVIARFNGCVYGGIEAIAHRTLPIVGVQYHPEELYIDPFSDNIIQQLLYSKSSILEEPVIQEKLN